MRMLHRYVTGQYVLLLFMCLAVTGLLLGVVAVAGLLRIRVPLDTAFVIFGCSLPNLFTFLAPVAAGIASVMLFHFLAQAGELPVLSACGVNRWLFIRPILLVNVLVAAVSLHLNLRIAPESHYLRRQVLARAVLEDPLAFLREGRFTDTPLGYKIYIGGMEGDRFRDFVLIDQRDARGTRIVKAAEGRVETRPEDGGKDLVLENPHLSVPDPSSAGEALDHARGLSADLTRLTLPAPDKGAGELAPKMSDATVETLFVHLLNPTDPGRRKAGMELNQRVVLAAACVSFSVLGMPLGMLQRGRGHRVAGFAVMLAVIFLQYLLILYAETVYDRPQLHPNVFLWLAVAGSLAAGVGMIHRYR